jgi:hypothetical protein
MSDVFYLRPLSPPATLAGVLEMSKHAGGCFDLHRVDWVRSFLSSDGARMLCWYKAPDAESVRIALRQLGADTSKAWPGSARVLLDDAAAKDDSIARVAAEYVFDRRDREGSDELAVTLGARGVHPELMIESTDGTRAVVVLRDRNDERVRKALDAATPAPRSMWSCAAVTPPT